MTAKRFKFICDDEKCFFKDGNKALYCYEVVDLLNSLYEENEQLKKECYGNLDGLNYYQEQNGHLSSKISDLECENEQLEEAREYYQENFLTMKTERNQFKRENELLKFQLDECRNNKLFSRRELEKENEQLKEENKELKKQMNRLYNYFMDWHGDEMGGNQFSEMWDMVKEDERWEEKW